jgi:hypothetical protein
MVANHEAAMAAAVLNESMMCGWWWLWNRERKSGGWLWIMGRAVGVTCKELLDKCFLRQDRLKVKGRQYQ